MTARSDEPGYEKLRDQLVDDLKSLWGSAGSPSVRSLEQEAQRIGQRLTKSSISEKLGGKVMPSLEFVLAFVRTCAAIAASKGSPLPPETVDLARWERAQERLVGAADRARADRTAAAWARQELNKRANERLGAPRQLPPASRHFAGRATEQAALTRVLDRGAAHGTVVVSAIVGAAGVGKTALALRWAHQMIERFPDGQLFLNLRGYDPAARPLMPSEAIRILLDGLRVPADSIPATPDAQAGLLRGQLAGRRILILLDNALNAEQVRPLLPSSPTAHVLVTSRNHLTALVASDGAEPIVVDVLPTVEARQLLSNRLGDERLATEDSAVAEIVDRCARLPLALCIVAARAANRPEVPLADLVRELTDGGLDAFDGGDPATQVRAVFSWSYRALSPQSATMFRLLASHPGQSISISAAASLGGLTHAAASHALRELADAHLIEERPGGRFEQHDLMRAYAAELAGAETAAQRDAANRRLLDYYLHTAHRAAYLLDPLRTHYPLGAAQPGVTPDSFSDESQAMRWFDAEHLALLAIMRRAAGQHLPTHAWLLARELLDFLHRRVHWHDQVAVQRLAVDAAKELGNAAWQAIALRSLGHALTRVDHLDEARVELERAVRIFDELGDRSGQAYTAINIGWLLEQQGDVRAALGHVRRAYELHLDDGDLPGQAIALGMLGWQHNLLTEYDQAVEHCRRALRIAQEIGDKYTEAGAWDSLGCAYHGVGDLTQALECLERSRQICAQIGERHQETLALTHLGEVHVAAGDPNAAKRAWQAALTILVELDHPDAESIEHRLGDLTPADQD